MSESWPFFLSLSFPVYADLSPLPSCSTNPERGVTFSGAFAHGVETHASAGLAGVKALTIILNTQFNAPANGSQHDGNVPGVGVFDGIVKRFLRNMIEMRAYFARDRFVAYGAEPNIDH